jgi:hypothetical protein
MPFFILSDLKSRVNRTRPAVDTASLVQLSPQCPNVPHADVKFPRQFHVVERGFLLQKVVKINGKQAPVGFLGKRFLVGLSHRVFLAFSMNALLPSMASSGEKHKRGGSMRAALRVTICNRGRSLSDDAGKRRGKAEGISWQIMH